MGRPNGLYIVTREAQTACPMPYENRLEFGIEELPKLTRHQARRTAAWRDGDAGPKALESYPLP